MSTRTCIKIKGQGHSLTLVQGHSDSTFSNFISLETARPIEAKFHMEPPWDREMKVNIYCLCRVIKKATMPIYSKKTLNIFFSGTKKSMSLTFGLRHWLLEYYQVCSSDDSVLTVTYIFSQVKVGP